MIRNQHIATAILVVSLMIWSALATTVAGAQDATPQMWPSSEVAEAVAGQEFMVSIRVTGASQVYGSSFQLSYDPQSFKVILVENKAVTNGDFFSEGPSFALRNTADAAAGLVEYALTLTQPAQPVTGDGVIGLVKFRALKDAPVVITLASPTLVSPEFTEIDGQMVAQKINKVEAVASDMTVGEVSVPQMNSQPDEIVPEDITSVMVDEQPPVIEESAGVSASVSSASVPPQILTEERQGSPNSKMLVVAALFFIGGLLLLTVSVGMYSKMRVRLTLAGDYPPERM